MSTFLVLKQGLQITGFDNITCGGSNRREQPSFITAKQREYVYLPIGTAAMMRVVGSILPGSEITLSAFDNRPERDSEKYPGGLLGNTRLVVNYEGAPFGRSENSQLFKFPQIATLFSCELNTDLFKNKPLNSPNIGRIWNSNSVNYYKLGEECPGTPEGVLNYLMQNSKNRK